MIRFIALLLLSFFTISSAYAHEFKQLHRVFNLLKTDYVNQVDVKSLVLDSCKKFSSFDKDIKFYHSDSKAFLYYQNQLIETFVLPNQDDFSLWDDFLTHLLAVEVSYSPVMAEKTSEIEEYLVKYLTTSLDTYSRIEAFHAEENNLDYTIKNNVLYIKSTAFTHGLTDNLKNIISQYKDIDGLILDLRGNRGGQFNEAVKVADLFLDKSLITYSAERNKPKRFYTATAGDVLRGKPLVVLTDEYTASAAEIVAAALSEQSRATLIGTRTYGKGSIQQLYHFDQKTLYLTSGYFYSPSGKKINHDGVLPQICTGIDSGCQKSDKSDARKDILTAINFIKKNLG